MNKWRNSSGENSAQHNVLDGCDGLFAHEDACLSNPTSLIYVPDIEIQPAEIGVMAYQALQMDIRNGLHGLYDDRYVRNPPCILRPKHVHGSEKTASVGLWGKIWSQSQIEVGLNGPV